MNIKLMLNDENIEEIIGYLNDHPHETQKLIDMFAEEFFKVLVNPRTVKKLSGFYKAMNKEINRKYWDKEK